MTPSLNRIDKNTVFSQRRGQRQVLGLAATSLVLLVVWRAAADQPETSRRHFGVTGFTEQEVREAIAGTPTWHSGSFQTNDGHEVEAPPLTGPSEAESGERNTAQHNAFHADRVTELEDASDYHESFRPSIVPFDRVHSLDRVLLSGDGTPVIEAREEVLYPLPVGGERDPRNDLFWGEVVLDFTSSERVIVPSVSPDSRILEYATAPEGTLRFLRDVSGNFYAERLSGPARMRLVFQTDAPASFFGGPLPDVATNRLASEVPQLPAPIRDRALGLLLEIGIDRDLGYRATVEGLTNYLRSFVESSEAPADTGDLLSDLARGRVGICRHRAFVFTILAQAAGIPTRFVHNEAHAWVEVRVPAAEEFDERWLRIDLGGSLRGVSQTPAGPNHRPRVPDMLPRPEAYLQALAQSQNAQSQNSAQNGSGQNSGTQTTGPDGEMSGPENGSESGQGANDDRTPAEVALAEASESGDEVAGRASVRLFASVEPGVSRRARPILVMGRALSGSVPVPGILVDVVMVGTGEPRLLGSASTAVDGSFEVRAVVPSVAELGTYRIEARFRGDQNYGPAHS